jgi:hypothetical protein
MYNSAQKSMFPRLTTAGIPVRTQQFAAGSDTCRNTVERWFPRYHLEPPHGAEP